MEDVNDETGDDNLGVKAITHRFKENTTAHGIPHVSNAKGKFRKVFWTIISLTATAGLIWNFYSLLTKYIAFEVNVKVKIEADRFLTFPAITFCNHSPMKLSKLNANPDLKVHVDAFVAGKRKKRDLSEYTGQEKQRVKSLSDRDRVPLGLEPQNSTSPKLLRVKRQSSSDRFQLLQNIYDAVVDLPIPERMDLGYELSNMILGCSFNGAECNMTSDFYQFYDITYGNCFTYNWGKETDSIATSYKPGANHGLTLTFNVDQDQYVGDFSSVAGLRLDVHPQSNMPFPSEEGISVSPGELTYVGVRKVQTMKLGERYGECYTSNVNDYYKNVYAEIYGVSYTSKACSLTCFQKAMIDECGCGDGAYPVQGTAFGNLDEKNVTACKRKNTTQMNCFIDMFEQYQNSLIKCDCPEPCIQIGYEYMSSSVIWPSVAYTPDVINYYGSAPSTVHLFANGSTDYKINMGQVVVYFEELNYQSVSESPAYTIGSLISDTGGILGLYLGFSALTILEFFELAGDLLAWCCIACFKRKNQEETQVKPMKTLHGYDNHDLKGVTTQA